MRAVAFSEIPAYLGLPSIHSGEWDPFFAACEATGTVLCLHIGSGTKMPSTSPDAPLGVTVTIGFGNCMNSLADWLFSGKLAQFPGLRLMYAESQIGWIPYLLERADDVWKQHRAWVSTGGEIDEPPSTYYYRQVFGCFFRDYHGMASLDECGVDNVMFEVDYPHSDSTWPDSRAVAAEIMAGLDSRRRAQARARERDHAVRPRPSRAPAAVAVARGVELARVGRRQRTPAGSTRHRRRVSRRSGGRARAPPDRVGRTPTARRAVGASGSWWSR